MPEDDRLLQSFLDGGQGKLSIINHPTRVESPSMGPGIKLSVGTTVDLCKHDKWDHKEYEKQSQGFAQSNIRGDQFH
jgi:hypothetical protein